MYTALSRLNAVFAFSLTVLATLTFLCFLSMIMKDRTTETSISTSSVTVELALERMASGPEQKEHATVKFSIDTDLSSLFDWNTRQLFVMLTAHYQTRRNSVNQVVLWDKIIKREDPATIKLKNAVTEYELFDDGYGMRGNKNLTLELSWNVVPQAGLLPLIKSGSYKTIFANDYTIPPHSRQRHM